MEMSVDQLEAQLAEKEEKLQLAGKLGKEVLERYQDVCDEMEKRAKEHATEIEKLEQEKYVLQLKVEQKTFSERTYSEEVESLRDSLRRQREEFELRLDTVNQDELLSLKHQLSSVRGDLEKAQLSDRQLKDRNDELQSMLEDVQERLRQKVSLLNETTSEEIAALHSEISTLHNDKMALMKELGDIKDECEHLRLQFESCKQQLVTTTAEMEQQQCQITSYYNALEKARDECKELKAEIDVLRMENQDQKKKGNSLFGEVEDRRIEAEKQLISMKVQYESMKKHSEATRQQLHRLKMQIAGLLQMSGRQADSEYMERLERQLVQARSEVDALTTKVHKLEEEKKLSGSRCDVDVAHQLGDSEDKFYVEFLKALLEKREKELLEQEKELKSKGLMLVAESDKLLQCERTLHVVQRQAETLQAQNIRLHVRLEELTAKYEPGKLQTNKKVHKTITEKIPVTTKKGSEEEEASIKQHAEKRREILQNLQADGVRSVTSVNAAIVSACATKTKAGQYTAKGSERLDGKTGSVVTATKRVANTGVENDFNSAVSAQEKNSAVPELKSVKLRKVRMAEEDDLIDVSCDQSSVPPPTDCGKRQAIKSQHKKVKVSEQPTNECQTQ